MEEIHRETIQRNISALTERVNVDRLYPLLINAQIIDHDDIQNIRENFPTEAGEKMEFFMWYHKRGPFAFACLIEGLRSSGHEEVAELLTRDLDSQNGRSNLEVAAGNLSLNGAHGITDEEFIDIHADSDAPACVACVPSDDDEKPILDVKVKHATTYNNGILEADHCYHMCSCPRGFALIINNINFDDKSQKRRQGAKQDSMHLKKLLQELGFKVFLYEDVGSRDLEIIIKKFKEEFKSVAVDACFVAIMSHGTDERLFMRDSAEINIWKQIVIPFNNINCKELIGKPKVFLINACRGTKGGPKSELADAGGHGPGEGSTASLHPPMGFRMQPEVKDIFVCYATVPGYVANRDPLAGSYYIYSFCKILMTHACERELKKLLDMVGREMENALSEELDFMPQVSSYANFGFFYDLYFNPGLYASETPET